LSQWISKVELCVQVLPRIMRRIAVITQPLAAHVDR
jgi:hypothetical protein